MDMLRTCYTSYMRLYPDDPDRLTLGRWAWCPEGAIDLPFEHSFLSSRFDPFSWRVDPDIGEVGGIQGYSSGKITPRYTGRHWCGGVILYQEGSPLSLEGTPPVDEEGVPLCCDAPPAVGGLAMGGEGVTAAPTLSGLWWMPETLAPLGPGIPIYDWTDSTGNGRDGLYSPAPAQAHTAWGSIGLMGALFTHNCYLNLATPWLIGTAVTSYCVFECIPSSSNLEKPTLNCTDQVGAGIPQWAGTTVYYQDSTSILTITQTSSASTMYLEGVRRDGSECEIDWQGTPIKTGTINPGGTNTFQGVHLSGGSFPFDGKTLIYEVLIFPFRLSDSQHDQMVEYFQEKYGIGGTPDVITGSLIYLATATVPTGYLACDGSAYLTTDYPALAALLGSAYNTYRGASAPAAGHFRVPDLRGLALVGGGSAASSPTTSARALGDVGGAEEVTLDLSTIPSHQHQVYYFDYSATSGGDTIHQVSDSGVFSGQKLSDNAGGGLAHVNLQPFGVGFPMIKT